jgi:hypothetical protein
MADLSTEERVANIERQLFGLSYEEAKPIYDGILKTYESMNGKPGIITAWHDANKELVEKLERVLGIQTSLFGFPRKS